jgi:hypothetical protein
VPTIEDIYFLTGLSRRGETIIFRTFPSRPHNISELIGLYCEAGTGQSSSQVPISKIPDLSLQTIVFLIGRMTGSVVLHQASRAQMNGAVQCLNTQIFDWSTTLLDFMKRQLIDCWSRMKRNFGSGMILCSFFFERVPSFIPRVVVRGHQACLPAVCRWALLLPRQGGGRTNESFDDDLFAWLSQQIPVIEDYPYVGIDFSRDPKLPVPPSEE